MRRTGIAIAVFVVALAAGVVGYQQLRNTTTTVEVADALERFESITAPAERAEPSLATTSTSTAPADPSPEGSGLVLPSPGVYRLDLRGEERIDLLSGAEHVYPGESFVTVTATDCGVDLRWDFIAERWQSWSFCEDDGGPVLVGEQIFHSFFGQEDLVERSCTDSALAIETTRWTCVGASSVATREVSIEQSIETVDGLGLRDVLVLRAELVEGDNVANIETIEMWWDLVTGLPVFEERFYDFVLDTPLGDAAYDESYRAVMASLEPVS